MLRVTVEIVPHGVEADKRVIGVLEIANDGTGTASDGCYFVKSFITEGTPDREKLPRRIKHKRALGFWPLIARCLSKIGLEA